MENLTFEQQHPIILADGRRFATLACAGHSLDCGDFWPNAAERAMPWATDMRNGKRYNFHEVVDAYKTRTTQEWEQITAPMGNYTKLQEGYRMREAAANA